MSKATIIFFSITLVLVSLYGLHDPGTSVEWLLAADNQLDWLRIGVVALLLTSLYYGHENLAIRYALKGMALVMFTILIGNMILPDLYIEQGLHLYSLDILTLIEGTIVSLLVGLEQDELPIQDTETTRSDRKPPMIYPA